MTRVFLIIFRTLLGVCLTFVGPVQAEADSASVQAQPFSYKVTQAPAFVAPFENAWSKTPPRAASGIRYLLVDRQISLVDKAPCNFLRLAVQPTDAQAVQKAAQLYVFFNPEYQTFELHAVRVIRDGRVMDRTAEVKFELLQRETKLDQQLYDGEVSAVAILPDIRVNDIIVFERSVVGDNPIFQGRFAGMYPMRGPTPTETFRQRLIYPANRAITLRSPAFAQESKENVGGKIILTVHADQVAALTDDPDRPRWFDPQAWIEISEYADWRDVERWAGGLFKVDATLVPELRRQVDAWHAKGMDQASLAAEALRWVQREIRYFGIEIGVNSHLPAPPNVTFERRYGDCKDKSLLLSTLLNALGIKARPALVSLDKQSGTAKMLPGPHLFDHAIVRAEIDGRAYWLDPTMPTQYGGLGELGAFDYGKALVIGGDANELTTVGFPVDYTNLYTVVDRFEVTDFKQPAQLVSELTMDHGAADRYRVLRTSLPSGEFDRILHSDYLRMFPSAEVVGPVEIKDDEAHNRFTLIRRYRIPELFTYEKGRFTFGTSSPLALDILRGPEIVRRSTPYDLPYPLEARISQIVVLPENPVRDVPPPSQERTPYFSIRSTFKSDEKALRKDSQISVLKDHVPTKAMLDYVEDIQRLRPKAGLSLTLHVGVLNDEDKQFLNKRLRRFDRYGKSRSGALNAQIDAEIGIRQITRDIESGKLSPRQQARAYADRAVHYDEIDKPDSAIPDIDKAMELDPGQVEYALTKARILAINGQFDEARRLFERLESEGQSHAMRESDLGALGRAYLYQGRYGDAARKFEQAAEASDREGSLIEAFWQHLAARRSQGQTRSLLEPRMSDESKRDWPYPVGEMLLDRISPEALLNAAKNEDKGIERDQLAEANFYLAQKFLLDGDKSKAGGFFEACVELDVTPFLEQRLAKIELKQFGERPKGFMKWLKGL